MNFDTLFTQWQKEYPLLDEVTANIDQDSEEGIKDVLHQLKEEQDLTIISISHRLNFLTETD